MVDPNKCNCIHFVSEMFYKNVLQKCPVLDAVNLKFVWPSSMHKTFFNNDCQKFEYEIELMIAELPLPFSSDWET